METILIISGQPGAGKTEVCRYLTETYGFESILISDLIRTYARKNKLVLNERADFLQVHTRMLKEFGKFYITEIIFNLKSDLVCVDGLRVPAHVERLRSHGAKIIALDCPAEIRFERAKKRKRDLDKSTIEDFLDEEESEAQNAEPFVQNTRTVMTMADFRIDSSGELPQVFRAIDKIVSKIISAR